MEGSSHAKTSSIRSSVSIEHRLVTDRHRHRAMATRASIWHAGKMLLKLLVRPPRHVPLMCHHLEWSTYSSCGGFGAFLPRYRPTVSENWPITAKSCRVDTWCAMCRTGIPRHRCKVTASHDDDADCLEGSIYLLLKCLSLSYIFLILRQPWWH